MWERRLVIAPTESLRVDPSVAPESPKGYTRRELEDIVAGVPEVYERMGQGWTPAHFAEARWSADSGLQRVGMTYAHLFDERSASAIRASYVGGRLEVDAGNHRVLAAQRTAMPAMPVVVSARDGRELDEAERVCAWKVRDVGAGRYLDAYRSHMREREISAGPTRDHEGPSRSRDRGHEFGFGR